MPPIRLKLSHILETCNATMQSRNYTEGEQNYCANHVVMCGSLPAENTSKYYKIYGLVQQSSSLSEVHEVYGRIAHDGRLSDWRCSCKAGESEQCKHVMAVLLSCYSKDISEMEEISSTDKKCMWNVLKKSAIAKYDVLPLETFCCYNKKRRVFNLFKAELNTERFDAQAAYNAYATIAGSELARHKVGFVKDNSNTDCQFQTSEGDEFSQIRKICEHAHKRNFEFLFEVALSEPRKCCRDFFRQQIITKINSFEVCTRTALLKSEWKKERRFRITGSRCKELFTYKKGDWKAKAESLAMPKPFSNKYVQHGIDNEPAAREFYVKDTENEVVECGLVVIEDHPWLGYSPDGIVLDSLSRPARLLEIKCPYKGKNQGMIAMLDELTLTAKGGYLIKRDEKYFLRKTHKYYGQIQLGMFLLNLPECDFVLFNTFDYAMSFETIPFDLDYIVKLTKELKLRYFNNLLHEFCSKSAM